MPNITAVWGFIGINSWISKRNKRFFDYKLFYDNPSCDYCTYILKRYFTWLLSYEKKKTNVINVKISKSGYVWS